MDHLEILLVEDNVKDAELTIRALRKNSLVNNLVHVQDGAQALDFIYCKGSFQDRNTKSKPKLILLDLKMPKIDGLEVLKIIKSDEEAKHIPVVVLTSSKEEKDLLESYKLVANSYIQKPVEFQKFITAIVDIGFFWVIINQNTQK
ncbi:MAG: response regulator [bacterium]|jgi:two-component system response regulator